MNVKLERIAIWRPTADEPAPRLDFLPPVRRRRLTPLDRVAIAAARKAHPEDDPIPVVFASRWGEIGTTERLMRQLHDEGEMSPADFSVSVHNAAPGALSVFTRNREPYTAIAAGADSFDIGIAEAAAMRRRVLFVYAEEATPAAYLESFPEPAESAFAVAMLIDGGVTSRGT